MSETQIHRSKTGAADGYYILYYTVIGPSRSRGPLKREHYLTIPAAVERVREMQRGNEYNPIEIRDAAEKLTTCVQMGWKTSPLLATAQLAEQLKFQW